MVRVLDYGVRIEQAREAVLAIVARDGVAALNQVTLAAELGLSLATVKRSISSSRVLPRLGVDLLARRFRREVTRQGWPDIREEFDCAVASQAGALALGPLEGSVADEGTRDEWVTALRALWCALPCDDSAAEDARSWATLTAAFSGCDDMIRELRDERQAWIAGLVEDVVARFPAPVASRDHEVTLLLAVVTGLIDGASRGRLAPHSARDALVCYALTRVPAHRSG